MKEFFGGSQLSPVHGPDEPAGRAHVQAAPVGPGPGRPVARARRVRRPRRPPQPLRPHLPDRDAGRPEHRPDRLARDLRADQRLRLHRDARTARSSGPSPTTTRSCSSYEAGADLAGKDGKVIVKKGEPFTEAAHKELARQKALAFPIRPIVTDEIDYLPADEEEEHHVAQANAPLDAEGHFIGRARAVALPGHLPGGAPGPDRVHGRQPQAGRLRRDGADPVPRARRRQPRPDGLEHAAPGGAAPRARGADRRHRHGGPRRARLRPGGHRPPRRRRDQRHGRARSRSRRTPASSTSTSCSSSCAATRAPASTSARSSRSASASTAATPSRTRRPPTAASSPSAGTSSWRS